MTITDKHIRLVQAAPQDFGIIKKLLSQSDLTITSLTPEGATFWLAFVDGVPGGCIGLEHGQGASLLRSAAVLPQFRGHGLGRALAQSALTHASLRGDHMVYLFSSEAGDYWQRFGFMPSTPAEVAAALPESAQVQSGLTRGWIHDEQVWKLDLTRARA